MPRLDRITLAALPAVIAGLVLSAFAFEPNARPELRSVYIPRVPHIPQKPDFCGEACAAMYLTALGKGHDQDAVFDAAELDPRLGRGCYTRDLAKALQNLGFRTGPVWSTIAAKNAGDELAAHFAVLHADLLAGVPSIVCSRYDDTPDATEHFRLVLGYDASTDEILYHEPAVKNGANHRMKRSKLLDLWPLKYESDRWTVIRLRLEPGSIQPHAPSESITAADYAQHIRRLKPKLPGPEFHIVIQHPFVVIGDEAPDLVERHSEHTIKWAVDRLKRDYFERDPDHIIDIWLFRDKAGYEKHATALFGEKPGTPYGYYTAKHRALVMNISTGGGTLVHEIVHPFMAANFPACPSWFNEGLASLYEQCTDKGGHIWGSTNWRLHGLQQAIKQGSVPTFETLCSTTTDEFYNEDPGTNYSQARYLCYSLQEHGLLVKYYHAFRKNAKLDPTGYKTLTQILGTNDMQKWQQDWEAYILTLKF